MHAHVLHELDAPRTPTSSSTSGAWCVEAASAGYTLEPKRKGSRLSRLVTHRSTAADTRARTRTRLPVKDIRPALWCRSSMKNKLRMPEMMATQCTLTGASAGCTRAGTLKSANRAHRGWHTDFAMRPVVFITPTSARRTGRRVRQGLQTRPTPRAHSRHPDALAHGRTPSTCGA